MNLSREEAKALIAIEKYLTNHSIIIPSQGAENKYDIYDKTGDQNYYAAMFRGRINPLKSYYKLIYRGNIRLIRVDIGDGGTHINPDGTIFPPGTPHIHLYDEVYHDSIAYPLPKIFNNTDDLPETLRTFLSYSNVLNVNEIDIIQQGGLFDE